MRAPLKQVRPALGEAGRSQTRSGDGEGWGRDRGRGTPELVSPSAGGGGRGRRARIAERNPDIDVGLRLPFDEAVAGVGPQQDALALVDTRNVIGVSLVRSGASAAMAGCVARQLAQAYTVDQLNDATFVTENPAVLTRIQAMAAACR